VRDPAPTGTILAEDIAARVIKGLGQSVIPSVIPARIGEKIREACSHGSALWVQTIPLAGAYCLSISYRLNPDGTINLEFHDWSGQIFWRGTFRPDHGD
jgi:hypothetical protein